MSACADIVVTISRLNPGGTTAPLGSGVLINKTLPRSLSNGTQGYAAFDVPITLGTDRLIPAGSALTTTVTVINHCGVNRGVTLVYDGSSAMIRISLAALCGDGIVDGQETCDDGNIMNGDGCPANYHIEAWTATTATHDLL